MSTVFVGKTVAENDEKAREKGGVAAVDRALTLLAALVDAAAPLSLAELSRRSGFYKSTVLRLMESLERGNLVTRLQDTSYTLGPMAWRLGNAFERSNDLTALVTPVLEGLVAKGTESASFHVPFDTRSRLCLLRVDSAHSTLDSVRQGQVLPLVGAAGTIIRNVREHGPAEYLHRELRSFGERDASCAGVARAVFGPGDRLLGVLSLSGPIERFTDEAVERMGGLLNEAVADLSRKLGR
ncbi:IclR family transcriptional regulator [Paracoccus sp. (in: a-proteobacteria)]|uniref:IclR family transcriptional regulator n=1 Tax=Paracoccus sp. TaxID=267 RepID=UPI0028ACC1C6|nr:helix-turn-helix domain-containing protein [Paracoccus sp. (in: a-proteobacteria)]